MRAKKSGIWDWVTQGNVSSLFSFYCALRLLDPVLPKHCAQNRSKTMLIIMN